MLNSDEVEVEVEGIKKSFRKIIYCDRKQSLKGHKITHNKMTTTNNSPTSSDE
jgi:hypothetical protein